MRPKCLLHGVLIVAFAAALSQTAAQRRSPDEPAQVRVQHMLIAFKRSVPGKKIERTKKDAQALATELHERALKGEDFDALVKEYTDDQYPGILVVINEPDDPLPRGAVRRRDLVPRFGDVAFALEVGGIGLAKYHGGMAPYGWHVIKRLE